MKARAFDNSIGKFIGSLDKKTGPKVVRTIELLEEYGPKLGMPHSRKVRDDIFELRIRGIQEVRIFYVFHKDSIIFLHAFMKKSQKIPKKELELALQRAKTLDKK
ncbi:MAG TPA: type II toxin-antitoxin system RelE/ParE family toxin [Candidatus Paceibacterota bacterium]